ncbi:protein of unknown function [Mariniphaga anaerophila]|uniref:Outer membrane protein beta-barrel domain-containing protein n=1 Tax=Mariniphaga anaerophila TaxID=1484053 RepID=A0A1M5B894_9BACT|nr:DUF5020 family protein [Mariniphaga anaerophila]SHF38527.1 protein of unknown function [Mariniphaga anaerophila]
MKRVLLSLFFIAMLFSVKAQNVQLHYDMGDGRGFFTSTVEMFRPDSWGSTFFFIDMDYSSDTRNVDNGVSLAYWEIARSFKWNETQKFQPRVEFNGGVMKLDGVESGFIPIENCWLGGVERTFASADFSKILTLQANYKYIQDKEDASFQLTAVWTIQMLEGKLTFTGFADFWKEDMFWGSHYRFLSEPQLWFNATKNLALGGEVELSNNFVANEFKVMPTLGVKYTF